MVTTIAADLSESAQVVLDGSGNGTAQLSPHGTRYSGYSWEPDLCYVSVAPLPGNNAPVLQAQATAYVSYGVQSAGPQDAIGTTATGSTGDTCGMTQTIKPNDWITVRWKNGDPGALATMRVTGKVNLPIPVATP